MIENALGGYAVQVSKGFRWFAHAIRKNVIVIGHDDIRENKEACGPSGLVESFANYLFEFVGLEDRETVMRNRSEKVAGRIY